MESLIGRVKMRLLFAKVFPSAFTTVENIAKKLLAAPLHLSRRHFLFPWARALPRRFRERQVYYTTTEQKGSFIVLYPAKRHNSNPFPGCPSASPCGSNLRLSSPQQYGTSAWETVTGDTSEFTGSEKKV